MPDDAPPLDQFWLLTGAVPAGPFTVAQVHAELAAGRATWQTPACPVGGSAWLPLVQSQGVGPPAPPQADSDPEARKARRATSPAPASETDEPLAGDIAGSLAMKGTAPGRQSRGSSAAPVVPSPPATPVAQESPPQTDSRPSVPVPAPRGTRPNPPDRFWLLVGTQTSGPFRAAHIRAKLRSRELPPDAKARRVGTEDWLPLSDAVGAVPKHASGGANASAAGGALMATAKADPQQPAAPPLPSGGGAETPIEVRCPCGRLMQADKAFAGRNVRCPYCKASVPVPAAPVAVAAPVNEKETPLDGAAAVAGGVIGLVVLGACSDYLPAGAVKVLVFAAVLAILGGLVVLFGGRQSDLFR